MEEKEPKLWHKTIFWKKLEQTLAVISGIGITTAGFEHAPYWVFITIGIVGVIAKVIFIWVEDRDEDGIIDLFQTKK